MCLTDVFFKNWDYVTITTKLLESRFVTLYIYVKFYFEYQIHSANLMAIRRSKYLNTINNLIV